MAANRVVGLLLIALGGGLLLINTTNLGGEVFLGILGLAFLAAYALQRQYGLLIPGAILSGLATGLAVQQQGGPEASVVFGLGAGFLLIAAVDRLSGADRGGWWWPLIPGGILTTIGVAALTGIEDLPSYVVPVVLMVVGGSLLLRRRGRPGPPPPPAHTSGRGSGRGVGTPG